MRLVADDPARLAGYVSNAVGAEIVGPFTALGWEVDGALAGAAVFNCFTGPDIEMTIAGRAAVTRQAMRTIADYVFRQLGVQRVSIRTRASRADVVDQAKRIGFSPEGYHPKLFGDDDGVSLGMTRDACRWLEMRI